MENKYQYNGQASFDNGRVADIRLQLLEPGDDLSDGTQTVLKRLLLVFGTVMLVDGEMAHGKSENGVQNTRELQCQRQQVLPKRVMPSIGVTNDEPRANRMVDCPWPKPLRGMIRQRKYTPMFGHAQRSPEDAKGETYNTRARSTRARGPRLETGQAHPDQETDLAVHQAAPRPGERPS